MLEEHTIKLTVAQQLGGNRAWHSQAAEEPAPPGILARVTFGLFGS